MSERAGHDVVPLRTAVGIFESLEMRGVRHCHWKSNQHLGAALAGMTDIDLLVDRKQAAICKDVLLQMGCRPFSSQVWVTYPGIEDWLGCDSDTGELFHVHLHFQLLTGKRHVKEWHLPLEEVVLQTCVRHHAYGIAVTDPSLELVLLVIRLYVKTPVPHRSWGPLGGRAVADDMRAEIEYLYRRSNVRDVRRFCSLVFGERDGTEVSTLIEGGELHRKRNIARLSGPVKRRFSPHRRYKYGRRVARLTTSNAAFVLSRLARKLNVDVRAGKRVSSGGLIIALIGSDGSGKSTLSSDLAGWLSWKIEARRHYLGRGDGPIGRSTSAIMRLWRILKRLGLARPGVAERLDRGEANPKAATVGYAFYAVSVARRRYAELKRMWRERCNGTVVIADRYPQTSVPSIHDGPLLQTNAAAFSGVAKWCVRMESRYIEKAKVLKPDVVIRLRVDADVALRRKPNESPLLVGRKIRLLDALQFPGARTYDVDASRPIHEVKRDVRRIVWECIS